MKAVTRCLALAVFLSSCLATAGCWDFKEVNHMNYLSALAIDYIDGEYVVYLQANTFTNIAKTESVKPQGNKTSVVGTGKGNTIGDAIFHLYQTAQMRVYWGQIKALVCTKRALLKAGVVDLTDLINRYREMRYNLWVFGTEDSPERLFNNAPYFGLSIFDSILMKPDETYRQFSLIAPMFLHRFLSDFYEKGKTAMLPILSYDKKSWEEGAKPSPQLKIVGAFFFRNEKLFGMLNGEQLEGKAFMTQKMIRMPIKIYNTNQTTPAVTFVVHTKKVRIDYEIEDNTVQYDITISVKAYLDEMMENISQERMKRLLKQAIAERIRSTYEIGKKIDTDVLNLQYDMYKFHHRDWVKYVKDDPKMKAARLRNIKVKASIAHSGKYKEYVY
ncbi:Ger(x)C family spore germination protein [Cohnella soli]|uniref:Ger(X)C family spore germination protein n=1 Tax=Cohnella soli TaxID=425005 RepID=A0ABW0HXB3_9BACL